jgi:hypothetical protein
MVSASPGNPRQIVLEEIWQRRVNEARRTYEKQPSDETRANLLSALRILGDLSLRGKLPPETDQQCLK